ncbi:hypothetical protein D0469_19340 [Peribacillus saganii]|uniref:Uncharacterized protein n=1 Tax=Peribacillus saganii TaxID=2303992 RepID=A0A372LCG4_9BACI|nr:hypothetical protein D0469_19340 [Peribacillus saganii]
MDAITRPFSHSSVTSFVIFICITANGCGQFFTFHLENILFTLFNSHVLPNMQEEAANQIDVLFSKSN